MTTGHSVETWEFFTKEPIALSSYALTCVALKNVGSFASQEFYICLHGCCGSLAENCGDLRRLAFFRVKWPNKYCGDLRRRRIHATTAQKQLKILAREIPYLNVRLRHTCMACVAKGTSSDNNTTTCMVCVALLIAFIKV